jgi:hypothetical protein
VKIQPRIGAAPPDGATKAAISCTLGASGTQVTSRTVANGSVSQYKYRIDVENPAPGVRPGSLHVQLGGRGSMHFEYVRGGRFIAADGTLLPRRVQLEIDSSRHAQAGIREGLRILGET